MARAMCLIVFAFCLLGSYSVLGKPTVRRGKGRAVPGRYMVKLKEGCEVERTARSMNSHFNPNPNSKAREKSPVKGTNVANPPGWADDRDQGPGKSENARVRFAFRKVFHGVSLEHVSEKSLEWTLTNDCVEYVEEVGVMTAVQSVGTDPSPVTMAANNYINWGLDRITEDVYDKPYSFDPAGNGTGISIYIVDSGVRRTHLEFGGRAFYLNVFDNPAELGDDNGHGTQVAGIAIGAWRGTARAADVISVKVLNDIGEGSSDDLLEALIAILTDEPDGGAVVSMSLASTVDYGYIHDALIDLQEAGFVLVAAAGNEYSDACFHFPAGYSEVISVGAINAKGNLASFSNHGPCVDLYAPGANIYTATNEGDDQVKKMKGTSFAAPFVSGAAAILLSEGVPPGDVKSTLIDDSTKSVTINTLPSDSYNRILYVEPKS